MENKELTPAEKYYKQHLKNVAAYQQRNLDKCRQKCKKYYNKNKDVDPEKHQEMLARKREYYREHIKPKREQQRLLIKAEKKAAKRHFMIDDKGDEVILKVDDKDDKDENDENDADDENDEN